MKSLNQRARNRWLVLYTLLKNPGLKNQRKQFKQENCVKPETMGDYLRRFMFGKKGQANTDSVSARPAIEIFTIIE
jgi:hypothetical protein